MTDSTKSPTWAIALSYGVAYIVPIAAIACFYLDAGVIFHILSWIYVIVLAFMTIIGLIAGTILHKIVRIILILAFLAVGCAVVGDVNKDGLLLGACLTCVMTVYASVVSLFRKRKEPDQLKDSQTSKEPSDKQDADNNAQNLELSAEETSQLIHDSLRSDVDSFIIGQPFPWKDYAYKGDHVTPVVNEEGFDVVISFRGITQDELNAVCSADATLSVMRTEFLPFFVLDFGGNLRVDFSLNILKMKETYRKLWLNRKEKDYSIRVFLLEGENTRLMAIRILPFDDMPFIRDICKNQLGRTVIELDHAIEETENRYSVADLVENADRTYRIKVGLTI